jgi:hypothetical protein
VKSQPDNILHSEAKVAIKLGRELEYDRRTEMPATTKLRPLSANSLSSALHRLGLSWWNFLSVFIGATLCVNAFAVNTYTPDSPSLWKTDSFLRYYNASAYSLYKINSNIQFSGLPFPPWSATLPIDWRGSPFGNATWDMYLHSLVWLFADAYAYDTYTTEADIEDAKSVIFDWDAKNDFPISTSAMAWYDHATAFRSAVVTYFYTRFLRERLSRDEEIKIFQLVREHASKLDQYFSATLGNGNNHDLMSAQALLNIGINFDFLPESTLWRDRALNRLNSLSFEIFDQFEGVNREQSTGYQIWDTNLFRDAYAYVGATGQSAPNLSREFITRMVEFVAVAMAPNGTMPAIGDTDFGMNARPYLERYQREGFAGQFSSFVLSQGLRGERPPDMSVYSNQGYVVLRPNYGETGAWSDDLHFLAKGGPGRRVHGHNDAGSFVLNAFGEEILVDSGGPYLYGDPAQKSFMGAWAHNVVVVDEADYSPLGDAPIIRSKDTIDYSFVEFMHDKIPNHRLKRAFLLLKPNALLIFDRLDSKDGIHHENDLLFHFNPSATVTSLDSAVVATGLKAGALINVFAPGALTTEVLRGQTTPYWLGWTTSAYGARASAPVARFRMLAGSTWFVSSVRPFRAGAVPDFRVQVKATVDGRWYADISDRTENRDWTVEFSDSGLVVTNHSPEAKDSDGDGVRDRVDNCLTVPNADQRDSNGDRHGNICDADLNNDGIVNAVDLAGFKRVFGTRDPHADFNGDGIVNAFDLARFKSLFGTRF